MNGNKLGLKLGRAGPEAADVMSHVDVCDSKPANVNKTGTAVEGGNKQAMPLKPTGGQLSPMDLGPELGVPAQAEHT